jgi:branched-chain amino acid transport system substrate-binding protein
MLIITAILLVSCTSTRPVTKIALIAPFEGLYRQTGYTALDAMRAAIAQSDTGGIDIMPLALDGSGSAEQVRRATQKALRDPSVAALVGPFDPSTIASLDDLLAADGRAWYIPSTQILTDTITAIAAHVDPTHKLLLAGDRELLAAVNAETLAARLDHPVRVSIDVAALPNHEETVIWLGDAAAAADYLIALRIAAPEAPFWLAFNGDTPIFAQRVLRTASPNGEIALLGPVYWAAWLDDEYTSWAETHQPNTPTAYVTYRATQRAIAQITGADTPNATSRLFIFQLQADGSSRLVAE